MLRGNHGVTFEDEEKVVEGGRSLDSVPSRLAERQLDFSSIVERESLAATVNWSTADVAGTVLFSAYLPFDLLTSVNNTPFTVFKYARLDSSIRIILQTQPFQAGMLCALFAPGLSIFDATTVYATNPQSMTVAPHVMIHAGQSVDTILEIPFVHPQDALDTDTLSSSGVGSFLVIVFNQLTVGAAAPQTTAPMTVFSSFKNSHFSVLKSSASLALRARPAVSVTAQGVMMSIPRKAANITRVIANTVDHVSDAVGAIAAESLDRPNIATSPPRVVNVGSTDTVTLQNIEQAYFLGECAVDRVVAKPPDFGGSPMDTNLGSLCRRSSYLVTTGWAASSPPGTLLYQGILNPCPGILMSAPDTPAFQPNLLEWASIPFSFWSGSLTYRVQIVCTGVHSGRLAFVTQYGQLPTGTVSLDDALGQYSTILDLTAKSNNFEINVPYRALSERLGIPNTGLSSTTFAQQCMGSWSLVVLNPLRYNEAVASFVSINIYSGGGPNFSLEFLGYNNANNVVIPISLFSSGPSPPPPRRRRRNPFAAPGPSSHN